MERLLKEERLYLILDLDQTILHATDQPVDLDSFANPEEVHHFTMNSDSHGFQNWHVKVRICRKSRGPLQFEQAQREAQNTIYVSHKVLGEESNLLTKNSSSGSQRE